MLYWDMTFISLFFLSLRKKLTPFFSSVMFFKVLQLISQNFPSITQYRKLVIFSEGHPFESLPSPAPSQFPMFQCITLMVHCQKKAGLLTPLTATLFTKYKSAQQWNQPLLYITLPCVRPILCGESFSLCGWSFLWISHCFPK